MTATEGYFGTNLIGIRATEDGELVVRAIQESEIEHASASGNSFAWPSADSDINAGDTVLYIENQSDDLLILDRAVFGVANVACEYHVGIGSAAGSTATGTTVTPINLNQQFSAKVFDAVAYHDETAIADASIMFEVNTETTGTVVVPLDGIILGKNHFIQINQETESTSGRVTVIGHFSSEVA